MDQPIGLRSKTLLKHRSFPVVSAEGTSASNPTPHCLPLCYVISMWTIPPILLTALHLHAQCTKPRCHMLGSFTVSAAGCARATRFARVLMSAARFVLTDTGSGIRVHVTLLLVHVTPRGASRITARAALKTVCFTAVASPMWLLNILLQ